MADFQLHLAETDPRRCRHILNLHQHLTPCLSNKGGEIFIFSMLQLYRLPVRVGTPLSTNNAQVLTTHCFSLTSFCCVLDVMMIPVRPSIVCFHPVDFFKRF